MTLLTETETRALVARVFARAGVRVPGMAEAAAHHLVLTEMMEIRTHGLARVGSYAARIRAGGIDPDAVPVVTRPAPALRLMDARAALGAAVAQHAMAEAVAAAREAGIGACFVRNSTHFGAIAPALWVAAEAGFASVVTSNSAPMIAPPGGREVRVGNAPFGIGLPHADGRHVMLDMALSVAARSKLRGAIARGETIPDTWATDADGHPTTDPQAAIKGVLLAIGGPKGAALAMALDLLAAGLSGAAMLSDVADNHRDPGIRPDVGQLFIAIDAARLMPPEVLDGRLDHAAALVADTPAVSSGPAPRLPGARALAALHRAQARGIDIPAALLEELEALAG